MTDNHQINYYYDNTNENQEEDIKLQNNNHYPTSNNIPQTNNYPTEEEIKPGIYYPTYSINEPDLGESAAPILPPQSQITEGNLSPAYNQVYIPPPQQQSSNRCKSCIIAFIIIFNILVIVGILLSLLL